MSIPSQVSGGISCRVGFNGILSFAIQTTKALLTIVSVFIFSYLLSSAFWAIPIHRVTRPVRVLRLDIRLPLLFSITQNPGIDLPPTNDRKPLATDYLLLVLGDANRLQQVFGNLLTNAIKFTANGGKVKVCVSVVMGNSNEQPISDYQLLITSYAQIQVADTGQGIAPEFLPYVFDYFRQADSSSTRSQAALGLRLAIVRQLSRNILIISEIAMPEEDGSQLMRQLRSQGKQMPAIALTAYARDSDVQTAIAAGFQHHLSKPIEPDALIALVAELVSRK